MINGKPKPVDTDQGKVKVPDVPEPVLRKMNHREWLSDFSAVLQIAPKDSPARVMTPFRAGAIARLVLAAKYIELLEKELHWLSRDNRGMRDRIVREGGKPPAPYLPAAEAVHENSSSAKPDEPEGR